MPWLALTLEADPASADALGDALLDAGALSVTVLEPDSPACRVIGLLALDADIQAFAAEAAHALGVPQLPPHRDLLNDTRVLRGGVSIHYLESKLAEERKKK